MYTQIYDTSNIAKSEQFSYWNDLVCNVFTQLDCRKKDRYNQSFVGSLEYFDLQRIEISVVESEASEVLHSKVHISQGNDDVFLVHFQLSGQSLNAQNGKEALLNYGDFSLYHTGAPYRLIFDKATKVMVVKIPTAILQQYIPQANSLIGLKVDYSSGVSLMLVNYLADLWQHKNRIGNLNHQVTMANVVLSLLSITYDMAYPDAIQVDNSSVRHAHVVRLKAYIDTHLSDPFLTPSKIASANNISQRYLRMLFSDERVTCSRYILVERLNRVAQALQSSSTQGVKISELAYRWGFNNMSHFSRSFKQQMGVSPKDFRECNKE